MPGTLYVVATPIGNLEDVTLRALRVLRESDIVCAEDTRVTRKLLSHYDIHTPLVSYHEHSRANKIEALRARLEEGRTLALVTDAGLPGISDPGEELIAMALSVGADVIPIPGACAVVTGLCVSGLPTKRFAFDGFPPRPRSARRTFFEALKGERRTIVLYEAPGRLRSTLDDLLSALGDRQVAVARELTKKFEEVHRGKLSVAVEKFGRDTPRGEFTLVIAGCGSAPVEPDADSPVSIDLLLRDAQTSGMSARDAVALVVRVSGRSRKDVYRACLDLDRRDSVQTGEPPTSRTETGESTE